MKPKADTRDKPNDIYSTKKCCRATVLLVFWVGLAHTVDDWRPLPLVMEIGNQILNTLWVGCVIHIARPEL